MRRTRVRWARVAAGLALAVTLTWLGPRAAAGGEERAEPSRIHMVREGETLWGIARDALGPTADPRPLVAWVVDRNGISGLIHPGQRLVLPPR